MQKYSLFELFLALGKQSMRDLMMRRKVCTEAKEVQKYLLPRFLKGRHVPRICSSHPKAPSKDKAHLLGIG